MDSATIKTLQASPAAFRAALRLPNGSPWRLDDWQAEFFTSTDPGWQRAIGRDVAGGFSRAWSIRHRGASKTHDIAVAIIWALFAGPRSRPVRGFVSAGDSDQARLVADAVRRIVRANEWLADFIDVQRNAVRNPHTDSVASILSSDAPTSMGLLPDFIICDELTCWQGRDLWDSLFSAAAKQPHTFLAVLGNAGFLDTWQAELWDALRSDRAWFCHTPTSIASWISPAALDEQRRVLPAVVYARLWANQWTVGEQGAILPDQLARANVLSGPQACRTDICSAYLCAADLATRRDKAAVVTLQFSGDGMIRLARAQSWHPLDFADRQIPQSLVEQAILQAHADFHLEGVVFDPASGGYAMMQRLTAQGLRCEAMAFTPQALDLMARSLLSVFADGRVQIFDCRELIADLAALKLVEGNLGWRLQAPRSSAGHHDLGIAFTIGLPVALRWCREVGPDYAYRLPRFVVDRLTSPLATWREERRRRGPPSMQDMLCDGGRGVGMRADGSTFAATGDPVLDLRLIDDVPGSQRNDEYRFH